MRIALLQNFVAPYRVSFYESLRDRLTSFRVFVSTPMESDRGWKVEWGTLEVTVQRNLTIRRPSRDPMGFTRTLQIHFPYDTIAQLWRYRPEAVISVELGLRSFQVAIYKMLRPSTRLLIWCKLSEHSERGWGRVRHALRRFIFSRADGVLVNGESGARYVAGFGVPDDRIFRINQPVDVAMFANAPRWRPETAATRLLCCGTLVSRKGVLPFLGQLERWAHDNPSAVLEIFWLGDGDLRAALEKFATSANLTQRFLGSVPYAELPEWYSHADILVLPSLLDEWGLVVNEAMASGLPVLGSLYAQAVTELIDDGVTGWIFDPKSESSVQSALDRVHATTPDALVAMRTACRRRIASLTPATAAAKIFDALCAVSQPRSGKAARHPATAVTNLLNGPTSA